ncbi:6757_t:CDS:2 [Acaulospora morrowiae]|uniref:6757_t:CDS:1 n=1 Tax=Acaulospora morrowiae TaxID=94023 RepID=A0A9N8ZUE1_9GLOM|nr:6757_t:CDS:2 [Acaulospora morrowiae]
MNLMNLNDIVNYLRFHLKNLVLWTAFSVSLKCLFLILNHITSKYNS